MSDQNNGHRERMRQRMMKEGLSGFQDHEILELLLYQSIPRKDTNKIAHQLLSQFGSIYNVLNASPEQLMLVEGISQVTACNLSMLKEVWQRYNRSGNQRIPLTGIKNLIAFAQNVIGGDYTEKLIVIYVDNATKHLFHEVFSSNSRETVHLDVKKIVSIAVRLNASGVIICHCHPDGVCEPSEQDVKFTRSLFFALASLNVLIMDHVIFNGSKDYFSFFDNGLMQKMHKEYMRTVI